MDHPQPRSATTRFNMVEGQLRPNKINNPEVLARFTTVAREDFVPASTRPLAYVDQPTPIGQGRELLSPLVAARLIQELDISPEGTVLVLAAGTGYTAAILSGLAAQVIAVEDNADLFALAQSNLKSYPNVKLLQTTVGAYKPGMSLQAILIDAPFAVLPNLATLGASLEEGGKLAAVRANSSTGLMEAVICTKVGKSLLEDVLFETKGTLHPSLTVAEAFVF